MAQSPNPGQTPFVDWLTTTLPANGYTVSQGTYTTFPGCNVFITAFKSCFGNNTATPYLITQPPIATPNNLPAYATDPDCLLTGTNPSGQTTSDLWQVAPNQAIVTIITLPPQAAYLGFQTYLLERSAALYPNAPAALPTEPSNCDGTNLNQGFLAAPDGNLVLFNNFTNAINNGLIAAQIPAFNGSAWNTTAPISDNTIAIITTPNKALAVDMTSLFSGNTDEIFTEAMPATIAAGDTNNNYLLYPCNGPINIPCDAFTSIIRYTLAQNCGLGACINAGNDCGGPTEDTDYYRTYEPGTLTYYPTQPNKLRPVFVVGNLHSDSPDDFSPNGTTILTAPVNNADYTGISIADISPQNNNWGVADAANPNSASEYYVPPNQRVMLGSAYTVLNYLTQNPNGTGPTLYSLLPTSVQQDIDNIYIHVFQRNDGAANGTNCSMQTCSNALAEDLTTIITGNAPFAPQPTIPPLPSTIPDSDSVRLTERAYLLAPTPNAPTLSENLTGAAVQYLQSPYIVCDITNTGCPAPAN